VAPAISVIAMNAADVANATAIISFFGDVILAVTLVYVIRTLATASGARADAQAAEDAVVQARKEAADLQIAAHELAARTARQAALRAQEAAERDERFAVAADQRAQEAARRDEKAADRQVAFERMRMLDRRRERVEGIAEIVENLFWTVGETGERVPSHQWMPLRNRLGVLMVGLRENLPACVALLNAATAAVASDNGPQARHEVEAELARIDDELRQIRFVTAISETMG
jgi:hypothetical protein